MKHTCIAEEAYRTLKRLGGLSLLAVILCHSGINAVGDEIHNSLALARVSTPPWGTTDIANAFEIHIRDQLPSSGGIVFQMVDCFEEGLVSYSLSMAYEEKAGNIDTKLISQYVMTVVSFNEKTKEVDKREIVVKRKDVEKFLREARKWCESAVLDADVENINIGPNRLIYFGAKKIDDSGYARGRFAFAQMTIGRQDQLEHKKGEVYDFIRKALRFFVEANANPNQ